MIFFLGSFCFFGFYLFTCYFVFLFLPFWSFPTVRCSVFVFFVTHPLLRVFFFLFFVFLSFPLLVATFLCFLATCSLWRVLFLHFSNILAVRSGSWFCWLILAPPLVSLVLIFDHFFFFSCALGVCVSVHLCFRLLVRVIFGFIFGLCHWSWSFFCLILAPPLASLVVIFYYHNMWSRWSSECVFLPTTDH